MRWSTPIASERLVKVASSSERFCACSASASMMIWRWLRKYAGRTCLNTASIPVGISPRPTGQRRMVLPLRPSCGLGRWLSVATSCTTRSSPSEKPSAARSSRVAKRLRVAGPWPATATHDSLKSMFSPVPWASTTRSRAPGATP